MIYQGKTKDYRVVERTYENGETEYYIQWCYKLWFTVWFGKRSRWNHFLTPDLANKTAQQFAQININWHTPNLYKDKPL